MVISFDEFKKEYRNYHTCGIPYIPYDLAFSSDCPCCCPDDKQWEEKCRKDYDKGRIVYKNGMWRKPVASS